jgi:hypothetical protein
MSEYTITIHPSGCRIIRGTGIPIADLAALATAWGGEPEMLFDSLLADRLRAIAVAGTAEQLAALAESLG